MTWTLVLYALLTAEPDGTVQKEWIVLEHHYTSLERCWRDAKELAAAEAHARHWTHVEGSCLASSSLILKGLRRSDAVPRP